jgi:CubicO group peptidase (beta-lactamase class C family)
MRTRRWHHMFLALMCLILMTALTIGNVDAGATQQGEAGYAAIDAYVTEQVNRLGIPGLALGIVEGSQIAHLQGFGAADSTGRAVTPQTPFNLGSLTKSFTALAVMQLVEAGQIDLDAPVQTYLPWFALADKDASARITVRHLLNNTSGISTKDGNRFWPSQQGLEEMVRGLDKIQLTQPVGTTYQYCNINFMIAGLIVEVVSGQSYADYVTERIYKPLDMRHSYASRAPALADGLAERYHYMFGQVFRDEGPMPPSFLPAGFLIASVEDMAHYAIAHLDDGRYGDTSILSPQGMAELHTPAVSQGGDRYYAMGWEVGTLDGVSAIWHTGDDSRIHSVIILMPDRGSGVILLANATGFEQQSQVDDTAVGVFLVLNGKAAARVSLPIGRRLQYWALLLAPLLQILGILLVWRNRQRIKGWGVLLTVILNLAVVLVLFRVSLQIITLPSMLVYYPELGYSLIVIATLGIGWSVIYTGMHLMMRRPEQGLSRS